MPRIKSLDIGWIVFYPSLLNPILWIALALWLCWTLLFTWWTCTSFFEKKKKYYEFKVDRARFKECCRTFFELLSASAVNTVWWNRKLSLAYGDFIAYKKIPGDIFPPGTYQYKRMVEEKYKRYIALKEKRVIY